MGIKQNVGVIEIWGLGIGVMGIKFIGSTVGVIGIRGLGIGVMGSFHSASTPLERHVFRHFSFQVVFVLYNKYNNFGYHWVVRNPYIPDFFFVKQVSSVSLTTRTFK
jgi:hypothetical protein